MAVNAKIGVFLGALRSGPADGWTFPALHRWKSPDMATKQVNVCLARWAASEGLDRFSFYAFRKSWATIARGLGVEKATIDEALAHVGDYRLADIYAGRNWSLAWEANDRVLTLFRWPEVTD